MKVQIKKKILSKVKVAGKKIHKVVTPNLIGMTKKARIKVVVLIKINIRTINKIIMTTSTILGWKISLSKQENKLNRILIKRKNGYSEKLNIQIRKILNLMRIYIKLQTLLKKN
jgi:hypothetical protein